jgi:hypothetical protein
VRSERERYWFHAKRYGYGWGLPATWQGWIVLVGYLVIVFAAVGFSGGNVWLFLLTMSVATALLLAVCFRKGEPARWRWGRKQRGA